MDISDKLFSCASETLKKAYAPYSHFKVGAALYADDLQIYTGCNVENTSFPCGTCAETGAISNMVSHGSTKILEILVISNSDDIITPCGACLQRIAEFADDSITVHLATSSGIKKSLLLKELLPHCFRTEKIK